MIQNGAPERLVRHERNALCGLHAHVLLLAGTACTSRCMRLEPRPELLLAILKVGFSDSGIVSHFGAKILKLPRAPYDNCPSLFTIPESIPTRGLVRPAAAFKYGVAHRALNSSRSKPDLNVIIGARPRSPPAAGSAQPPHAQ